MDNNFKVSGTSSCGNCFFPIVFNIQYCWFYFTLLYNTGFRNVNFYATNILNIQFDSIYSNIKYSDLFNR